MKITILGVAGVRTPLIIEAITKRQDKIDILLHNAREAMDLTDEADLEKAIRQIGNLYPLVVVKDGSHGSYACEKDQIY